MLLRCPRCGATVEQGLLTCPRCAAPSGEILPDRLGRVGIVARWKPLHLGHAAVLEALVARADELRIGIGSSSTYDLRNPFTADESERMIRLVLAARGRYTIVPVPDLGDGPRWRALVAELLGPLDLFVTANAYVRELLEGTYPLVHPVELVPEERRIALDATTVRKAMARGDGWRPLVPAVVADYIDGNGLAARFRREFGLETLALDAPAPPRSPAQPPADEDG